jgi:hypothetical protein
MFSSHLLPSTPRKTTEKQVDPIKIKITIAVIRMVVS